jgi:hypothetical protein
MQGSPLIAAEKMYEVYVGEVIVSIEEPMTLSLFRHL